MKKKAPLYFLLSIPTVFVWVLAFPPSGTRELYLTTEWHRDLGGLLTLPPESGSDPAAMDSVFFRGGVQKTNQDGTQGSFESGDMVAVLSGYRVELEDGSFVLVYNNGERADLGEASLVLTEDNFCALVTPDTCSVRIFLVNERRFLRFETSRSISALKGIGDSGLAIGTVDGSLMILDRDAKLVQELRLPGSDLGCVYGLAWLPKTGELLVLNGLYPQRLFYLQKGKDKKFQISSSVEMPFAVRFRSQISPVFGDQLVLFDLGTTVILYEPDSRLFHAIKHGGELVNALMMDGTDILALASNQGDRHRLSLIKPDGRSIATLEQQGSFSDMAASRGKGVLLSGSESIAKLRWSFR